MRVGWGRNNESFGEDPSLIAAMGASYIKGIQRGRVGIEDAAAADVWLPEDHGRPQASRRM